MASTITELFDVESGAKSIVNTNLTSTAEVVLSSGVRIRALEVDNTANAADTYLKIWNTGTVTVGTTDPDFVFLVANGEKTSLVGTNDKPLKCDTALTWATLTTGGTGGTTSPTSAVVVRATTVDV